MSADQITQHKMDDLCAIDIFAGICTFTAVSISGHQILKHLCNFYEAQIQLQIIRILAIIPVSSFKFDFLK